MTERYAHLRPDLFSARDLATIDLDLNASEPDPGPSGPENGHEMASPRRLPGRIQLKLRRKCRSRPVSRGLTQVSAPERVEDATQRNLSKPAVGFDALESPPQSLVAATLAQNGIQPAGGVSALSEELVGLVAQFAALATAALAAGALLDARQHLEDALHALASALGDDDPSRALPHPPTR